MSIANTCSIRLKKSLTHMQLICNFFLSQNNCQFTIPMQHLLLFSHYYTPIFYLSLYSTSLLTTTNKSILVNDISFIIKTNTLIIFLIFGHCSNMRLFMRRRDNFWPNISSARPCDSN